VPPKPPILTLPQTILSPAKRVMSLTDPTKKMSKSDPDPASRILLTDSKETIKKKINGARTDSMPGISYDREQRPGVSNLIDILSYMRKDGATSPETIAKEMSGADMSMKDLKERVAEAIDEGLRDVRDRYDEVKGKPNSYLNTCSREGVSTANSHATGMMNRIKAATGIKALAWGSDQLGHDIEE
jgi:tryptophanyl-tRNA synthetase